MEDEQESDTMSIGLFVLGFDASLPDVDGQFSGNTIADMSVQNLRCIHNLTRLIHLTMI